MFLKTFNMPTYQYNGNITFVNNEYKIKVNNGDLLLTDYVLPQEWTDFQLIDINTPQPLLPYSKNITIPNGNNLIIDLNKFNKIKIILLNSDIATLKIIFYDITYNNYILLDNKVNKYTINRQENLYSLLALNKIYLLADSGDANVKYIIDI